MSTEVTDDRRVSGLDGIRGLAALFVVLHHTYLLSYPGFPANTGPRWLSWLLYGHLAVVVFITLSGFSLGIGPARRDWQLGGRARFAYRRAWRILPPYWAALVFSLIIAWTVVPQPDELAPTGKSVVAYGLLLQDVIGSPTPNGAFWSIAVEAQLYVVFPLMLVLLRRAGTAVMVSVVTVAVAAVGVLAPHVAAVNLLLRLTPQFALLFAVGLAAAGILRATDRVRRLPWQWFALAAALPVLAWLVLRSTSRFADELFWVDLACAPAIALLLAAVATGRPRPLRRLLDTRPIRRLGTFSYSLYLIHAPIVVAVGEKIVAPHVRAGLPRFLVTLVLVVPLSLVAARWFAAVFEIPFQRYRSWSALREAVLARRHPAPVAPPAGPAAAEPAAQPCTQAAAQAAAQPAAQAAAQPAAQAAAQPAAQAAAQPAAQAAAQLVGRPKTAIGGAAIGRAQVPSISVVAIEPES
ncbi:acyltransferase [Actinoplanes sp. NPDC051411]|uniref:acyltransferase family protein n=1 Tax=Actinoplanes sp. NPDC051411 TaxID=3155522 RepID=UPI0034234617